MNKRFRFIHIEKAAGTSFHEAFFQSIKGYHVYYPFNWKIDNYLDQYTPERDQDLVSGLFGFKHGGGHSLRSFSHLNPEGYIFFTLLRNPVDRFISHYYHHKEVLKRDITFAEFANDDLMHNFMCKRISGENSFLKAKAEIERTKMMLGILEDLPHSIDILNSRLVAEKIGCIDEIPLSNTRNSRGGEVDLKLTKEELTLAKACNTEDILLYEYAKSKLDALKESQVYCHCQAVSLTHYRLRNRFVSRFLVRPLELLLRYVK